MAEDDVCFPAAKLFFAYGLGNAMTFPLWVGGTSILSDQRPSPEMTFDLIERLRPSLFFGAPTLYAAQLRALESRSADFSSLRACVSAGEALPADIFRQDKDGYFVYCGRTDDMLKVGGIWCSPVEIEGRLIEHTKVLGAAVVGRADEDQLVKPEAFIALKHPADSGDALAGKLLEHCNSGLARHKYPRWFNFVDELPKTATGKIQRFKLRRST